MFGITDLTTYLLGTIFIVLLPGPNSIYVLSVAGQRGIRAGYQGAAGVFLGDAVLMTLSATGVAGLLKASPGLFLVLKYAGAAYLCSIALQMFRKAWHGWKTAGKVEAMEQAVTDALVASAHPFRRALVISLLNPKAIIFFISFFIQFVDPVYPYPALTFSVLGAILEFFSALYLTAVILIGANVASAFRRRKKLSASLSGGMGVFFLGFSAKLATASMSQ